MNRDPLSVFLHEELADVGAPTTQAEQRYVTKDPDPSSLDPGERAIAGLAAAGAGSIAAKIIPWIGQQVLRSVATADSVPWHNFAQAQDAKSIGDMASGARSPRSKILGLFDVGSRTQALEAVDDVKDATRAATKLKSIQNVVDSFIDKHNLIEKGVRLNVHAGPLGSTLGPRYSIPTKQVFVPRVGKEILLHELGHAADYTAGRIGRFRGIAEPLLQKGVFAALPIALVAGDRIKEMLPGTIDDRAITFMQDHAPAIMGATLAATELYPEAKASFLAIKHIAKTEGSAAARLAMKRLAPAFGTYVLGAIPAIVGMSLARKYMREAREEKASVRNLAEQQMSDLEKTSSVWRDAGRVAKDIGHFGKQIGNQTVELFSQPDLGRRIFQAAKEVGTSPDFVYGALGAAIPATMGSLYLYGTESGKAIRSRIHPEHVSSTISGKDSLPLADHTSDTWRERHPLRFAGLVAAGAALSGGILAKFWSDLQRVL